MANKRNSSAVTIANVIAIVGLVMLLVFTFLGHSYMSGGEMGWDILISVGITAVTALLLWFLIKAKGAENKLSQWRVIEYVTLAVYVAFAIYAALYGGIMHFFVVNEHREQIKQYAKSDLDKINDMFNDYKEFETEAISRTGAGLIAATMPGQLCDQQLNKFMEDNHIDHTQESARNFEKLQKMSLVGSGFDTYYDSFRNQQREIESAVDGWSVMQVPMKAKQITELAESAQDDLNRLSANATLPVITADPLTGRFTLGENQTRHFSIDGDFKFRRALQEAVGFSLTAIAVVLLIHLFILFNYFVAYRTNSLGISKHSDNDGGTILNR